MKIGFIGCGNMGGALIRSISQISETNIYIYDKNIEKAQYLSDEVGAIVCEAGLIASGCDFIFLAVKPAILPDVLSSIAEGLGKNARAVVVSMAAGVNTQKIETALTHARPVIRIMPNTPVALGCGMIAWCAGDAVPLPKDREDEFLHIMSACGRLDRLDERLIDAETAVAGCGPAYAYMFIDALADGGVLCGLPRDRAILYAAEMLKGAAEMVLRTGKHPGQLKDEVCSPGGSTIEGVKALEDGGFRGVCAEAVIAAYEKNKLLGS